MHGSIPGPSTYESQCCSGCLLPPSAPVPCKHQRQSPVTPGRTARMPHPERERERERESITPLPPRGKHPFPALRLMQVLPGQQPAAGVRARMPLGPPGARTSAVSKVVGNVNLEKKLVFVAAKEPFRRRKRAEGPFLFQVRYRLYKNPAAICIQIVVRFTGPRCGVNNRPGRSGPHPTPHGKAPSRLYCVMYRCRYRFVCAY